MPGPVSDSYDPEWGTGDNANQIRESIQKVYDKLSSILDQQPPLPILQVVQSNRLNKMIDASFREKEWRILRFACERAKDSI